MNKKLLLIIEIPLILLILIFLFHQNLIQGSSYKDIYREAEIIAEVRDKILKNYIEEVSPKKLLEGALQGMMSVLDPYSEYLDEETFKEFFESAQGEFIGVGIVITQENGILTVISPIEDSPAAKAGILAGDKIIAINGESTEGMTLNDAVIRIRGKKGTKVTLTVIHEGEKTPKDIEIIRDVILIKSVKNIKIVDKSAKIGYLRISKFNEHTSDELTKGIETLKKQGMKSLIIDLRYNPGGLLDAAVKVVDHFIDDGIIVYTKGRTLDSYSVFRASKKGTYKDIPLAILINKWSASASEIVSAALQDYHRAVIVGTRSYGKGSVQSILLLKDEKTAIKLTTAKYYSPSGRSIQKTDKYRGGVIPDVVVPLTLEEEKEVMEAFYRPYKKDNKKEIKDKQLQTAINILKNEPILLKFK